MKIGRVQNWLFLAQKVRLLPWVFGENWSGPKLVVFGSKSKVIALGFW